MNKVKSINYGNETEYITEPFIMVSKDLRRISDEIRKSLKHKRKPTEIIVSTDGFSLSSTSIIAFILLFFKNKILFKFIK